MVGFLVSHIKESLPFPLKLIKPIFSVLLSCRANIFKVLEKKLIHSKVKGTPAELPFFEAPTRTLKDGASFAEDPLISLNVKGWGMRSMSE
jgi:hypothetical protein